MTRRAWKHGDHNAWYRHKCRCDICTGWYEATRRPRKQWNHGLTGYEAYGCRCEICVAAKSASNRRAYEGRKEDRKIARRKREAAEAEAAQRERQAAKQREWQAVAGVGVRRPVPGLDLRLLGKP